MQAHHHSRSLTHSHPHSLLMAVLRLATGETAWYDQAWVEVLDETYIGSPAALDANQSTRTLHFRPTPEAMNHPPYASAGSYAGKSCAVGADIAERGLDGEMRDEEEDVGMEGTVAMRGAGEGAAQDRWWQEEREAWRHGKFAHTLVSVAGVEPGATEHTITTTFYFLNAALLHGRWYLLPESTGSFVNVSCYARHGAMPGEHPTRKHMPHEDEADELAERHRPRSLTESCFMILGGPWIFEHCDVVCHDGTAMSLCDAYAQADVTRCLVGAAAFVGRLANGSWAVDHTEGRARIGIEMEGRARLLLQESTVQFTDFAGIRMDEAAQAEVRGCRLEHNGLLGGAALSLSRASAANVHNSSIVCGKSVSPTFPRLAAFEAAVSSRSQGKLELADVICDGRLWLHQHRPRALKLRNVTANEPLEPHDLGGIVRDGRAMAMAEGITDPILLWGTRHQEIWWSQARLQEIGLEFTELPEDGHGQLRRAPEDDVTFQDTSKEDDLVWGNRQARIRLHAWGWEGSLCDVFDTQSDVVMSVHEGFWQPWEDVTEQIENRFRTRYKKSVESLAASRAAAAQACIQLFSKSASVRRQAALELPELCPRGDLAACLWLRKAVAAEADAAVCDALTQALRHVEIRDAEARMTAHQLRQQLSEVKFDEFGGAPGQQLVLGDEDGKSVDDGGRGWCIPVDSLPPAVRCAVFPLAPLYPQCQDSGGVPLGLAAPPLPPLRLRLTWDLDGRLGGAGLGSTGKGVGVGGCKGGEWDEIHVTEGTIGGSHDEVGKISQEENTCRQRHQTESGGDKEETVMEEEGEAMDDEDDDQERERKRLRRKHGVWSKKHQAERRRGLGQAPVGPRGGHRSRPSRRPSVSLLDSGARGACTLYSCTAVLVRYF